MEVRLSQNIKASRKSFGLTQEQLAEAMGVSVGTVSKWESGSSSPDIEMIVELADFFQKSVDSLLGYDWKHRSAGQMVEHLRTLKNAHCYEVGVVEAKKALQKFPNQIEVLNECGELLYMSALVQKKLGTGEELNRNLKLAIEVFQKVVKLSEQYGDSAVSSVKIHQKIGLIYGVLGQKEEAVSYLEKHNIFDVNDWMIGNFLASLKQYDRAWDIVAGVFQQRVFELFQCFWVMYFVMINIGKYDDLLRFATWMENFCLSVQDGKASYYVRAGAMTEAMIAVVYAYKSVAENKDYTLDIRHWLRKAVENAESFDSNPDYSGKTPFTNHKSEAVYDGHGESAILVVQGMILGSKDDEKEFSVLRGIYDSFVSEIGHDEWKIKENNES